MKAAGKITLVSITTTVFTLASLTVLTPANSVSKNNTNTTIINNGETTNNIKGNTRNEKVKSIIVKYVKGAPTTQVGSKPLGTEHIPYAMKKQLRVGAALGAGMWRIDFPKQIKIAEAEKISQLFTKSKFVVFAEPDRMMSTR